MFRVVLDMPLRCCSTFIFHFNQAFTKPRPELLVKMVSITVTFLISFQFFLHKSYSENTSGRTIILDFNVPEKMARLVDFQCRRHVFVLESRC